MTAQRGVYTILGKAQYAGNAQACMSHEPIAILRSPRSVRMVGITDTEERKASSIAICDRSFDMLNNRKIYAVAVSLHCWLVTF